MYLFGSAIEQAGPFRARLLRSGKVSKYLYFWSPFNNVDLDNYYFVALVGLALTIMSFSLSGDDRGRPLGVAFSVAVIIVVQHLEALRQIHSCGNATTFCCGFRRGSVGAWSKFSLKLHG